MMLSDVCHLSVTYIVNIDGVHSYWRQGALGAAGVYGLELGRTVCRGGGNGAYSTASCTACLFQILLEASFKSLCHK